ncbi:hypothetical protein KIN20_013140 [Parelaphostrongylus tenuis]|uniref:Secreted protein n=1 Tax=Parelaphostrongylus tenuis TaxID=148309 RepID=A0AAD5QME6_PARTN|nr:hypothetical protein KIN20_013140 [Parelaphostrongylus tenuis]
MMDHLRRKALLGIFFHTVSAVNNFGFKEESCTSETSSLRNWIKGYAANDRKLEMLSDRTGTEDQRMSTWCALAANGQKRMGHVK